ncbi:MAG TPA: sigma-70 family RNA polymerase sigma factor [Gemmataceae bacterium]|nr:sigma-70 family RNA polymerase sigma factor [Gemmataceae bacterium]
MDRDVIVQVLLRERVRLTASAVVIARDVHAADDIFQQVVLAALQAAEKFQDAHHVLAWALRAARHRAIDLAHQRRLVPLPDDVLDLMETDWSDPAAWSDQAEALHRCLARVAGPAREILRLRYAEGMTAVAIARRLRRTADAVYQMLSRTHRALRQCVDRELSTVGEPAKGGVS